MELAIKNDTEVPSKSSEKILFPWGGIGTSVFCRSLLLKS